VQIIEKRPGLPTHPPDSAFSSNFPTVQSLICHAGSAGHAEKASRELDIRTMPSARTLETSELDHGNVPTVRTTVMIDIAGPAAARE
jgi:hypothetical protein